jgi:ribose-phosphate pyrophosphokinase
MSFTKPANFGIISCPGGEVFSNEVTHHLTGIYKSRFQRRVSELSRVYDMSRDEIIKQINFITDLSFSSTVKKGPRTTYHPPKFKIPASFTRFANGEFKTEILSSIRGMDIFIFQDVENTQPVSFNGNGEEHTLSVNDHIFSLLVTIDAAWQAGAKSIVLVLPAYPYARQHKKKGREGLTAARVGQMIEDQGVNRIITLDIHSRDIENSFRTLRLENLHASYQIIKKLSELIDLDDPDIVVVAPDTGAVSRNKFYASTLKKPLALLYKERNYSKITTSAGDNNITSLNLLGSVEGKTVFIADDMLGTGGTLLKAMNLLTELGAAQIICAVSLPFFTGSAVEHFEKAYKEGIFHRIIGTNAVYHGDELLDKEWFVTTNISKLFASIILRLQHDQSISALLDNRNIIQYLMKDKEKPGAP